MFARPSGLVRLFLFMLCAFFLLALFLVSPAYAAGDPITISSQTHTVNFPNAIDFTVQAIDTSSPINTANIFIAYNSNGYGAPHTATITSGANGIIAARWHEDTSNSSTFEPPGTQVNYYWQLQDNAGHFYSQTTQNFTTVDTRFTWQHLSKGLLQVNWYSRTADFGQIILNQASSSITRISDVLGGGPNHALNLWVYQNDQDFHGSLAPGSYEWVGGIAFPSLNEASIVVSTTSDDTLIRDMPHELTHLVFHQLTAQGIEAPVWFDEGLAVYNQTYHEPNMQRRLEQALASHTLLRLDEITLSFPADADKAYLAYAQSWNLLEYMYNTFGKAKMAQLIRDMNNRQNIFNEDLVQALNLDQPHLENQWRVQLHQSSVLQPDQLTPTPRATLPAMPQPIKVQVPADNSEPILVVLGIVLILLPVTGLGLLFRRNQRRKQQQALATQAALRNTYPVRTSQPGAPTYAPGQYSLPNGNVGQDHPMVESSLFPLSPTWMENPHIVSIDGDMVFGQNQEYLNQSPRKQVSQE